MPTPRPDESRGAYLQRCIPTLINEGKPQDQAVAICSSMYERAASVRSTLRRALTKVMR